MGIFDDIIGMGKAELSKRPEPYPSLGDEVEKNWRENASDETKRNRLTLLLGLYGSLFHGSSVAENTQRDRYAEALMHIALFLQNEEFPTQITAEIVELASALIELNRGTVRPFLVVEKASKPIDPEDIWTCRAMVAFALDFMIFQGTSKSDALTFIERDFGFLAPVLTKTSASFGGSISNWRKDFRARKVKAPNAQLCFDNMINVCSRYAAIGFAKDSIPRKILADATMTAARISDEAMRILLPEIEKRRRQRS